VAVVQRLEDLDEKGEKVAAPQEALLLVHLVGDLGQGHGLYKPRQQVLSQTQADQQLKLAVLAERRSVDLVHQLDVQTPDAGDLPALQTAASASASIAERGV